MVLTNVPVVKPLSVGEYPTANMCAKHITQGKIAETIQVSSSVLDVLIMKQKEILVLKKANQKTQA